MANTEVKTKEDVAEGKGLKQSDIMSPWKIVWKRLKKNKLAMVGLCIISFIASLAILAPWITPHGRDTINLGIRFTGPTAQNWLGTDDMGRDIFTRLIYASRISLTVGLVSQSLRLVIGVFLGGIAGYYGGKIDNLVMRIADMFNCFPFFIIAITFVAILGPSIYNTMIVLAILGWPGLARLVRGEILSLREREFMEAATALGISDRRKIFRHLLPNTMASIIVSTTLGIAGAILTESALSYLGLGVQVPTPSWGNILRLGQNMFALQNYWWVWVPPGLAIFVTVMSLNLFGDGLRDALDPRLKQ